jgi:Ca2+-dependent lipid-binding protein
MDITSSDPYCDIRCNGLALQSSVKWTNLNPEYHESFEIDVTNPAALLTIVVMDKDYFGSDDFMGQVQIELSEFADGVEREKVSPAPCCVYLAIVWALFPKTCFISMLLHQD